MMDEDKQVQELPEAVMSLIEARTGDAIYVVDPDYRIVHWDSRMESITGALAQEALGQPRDSQGTHDTLEMSHGLIQLSSKKESPAPRRRDVPALTSRQLEVLQLLSEGNSVREIGKELYLSEATIRNHVRSLLQALGAHSQLEVLAKAREMGILGG